jgi:ribosomal protein S27AE
MSRGQAIRQARPICPHCGDMAPHGDARIPWLNSHIDSRLHRWWWGFRNYWRI